MTEPGTTDARTTELATTLAQVDDRIARACVAVGRRRDDVTLVVVTKTWPAADVRRLAALGVHDVGENRDQEAAAKAAACADLDLRWHFVGRLQTNKCRSVARYADVVHAVDRADVVDALAAGATAAARRLSCLVQVSLDGDTDRGGAIASDVLRLAARIDAADALDLGGVMAVAPLGSDPAGAFADLAEVAAVVRARYPQAWVISAGMSGDLEAAVAAGATHVRVGTAVLGGRPPLG